MSSREEREAAARERREAKKQALRAKRAARRGQAADDGMGGFPGQNARAELLADAPKKDMRQIAKEDMRDNKDILSSTIRVAMDAKEIGNYTATQLDEQQAQMARVDNDLMEINDTTGRSERIIRSMKSYKGKFKNMFSRAKKTEREPEALKYTTYSEKVAAARAPKYDDEGNLIPPTQEEVEAAELEAKIEQARMERDMQRGTRVARGPIVDEEGNYIPRLEEVRVVKRGSLEQLEVVKGVFGKMKNKWKSLYFVCNEDYLFGYSSEKQADANKVPPFKIPLETLGNFQLYSDGEYKKPCTFSFVDPMADTTLTFAAADIQDRREWNDAICRKGRVALLGDDHSRPERGANQRKGPRLQDREDLTAEQMREEFGKNIEEEDEQLAILGGLMDTLKFQGMAMNKSLKDQNKIIAHLDDNTDNTLGRLEHATKEVNTLLK